ENFATVYRGVTIGNRVFIGPHACFTNDTYPRAVSPDWKVVPTKVEDGASIGANATVLCGLTIGKNAMVAAGAVVTKDVPPHALASGILAQGPKVKAFESAFAKDVGRKHGIAVANGTEALHIALAAHGIGEGNEVLIPPLTFFATASTVLQRGAKPVFVDVTRDSYNMDPARLSVGITRKTAAIMPVHLYGQTAEMDAILDTARGEGIPVVEDAAQAHGAEYH